MRCVALGTAEELIRLGYVTESLKLLRFFYSEIGGVKTMIIALNLFLKRRTPKWFSDSHWLCRTLDSILDR